MKIGFNQEKEIIERYKKGRLISELSNCYDCHHMTIRRHLNGKIKLRANGLDVSKSKTKNWLFNDLQKDILGGLLLGDGCITSNFQRKLSKKFVLANNSKEFCLHIKNLMPEGHFNLVKNSKVSFHLVGKSCDFIKKMFYDWYKNEKVLPGYFKLNKIKLYYWYLCDGSLRNRSERNPNIRLYTDGLHINYVKRLSEQLDNLGFKNTVVKHNYASSCKKDYGFAIGISSHSTRDFLTFLGNNKVKFYDYKWHIKQIKGEK